MQLFKNSFVALRTESSEQVGCGVQADICNFLYAHSPHALYTESS